MSVLQDLYRLHGEVMVRARIKANLSPVIEAEYQYGTATQFEWYYNNHKPETVSKGKLIAEAKARAQKYYQTDIVTAGDAFNAVISYMNVLDSTFYFLRTKVEPTTGKVHEHRFSDESDKAWEFILVRELHPCWDTIMCDDEVRAEYRTILTNIERIQLLHNLHVSEMNPMQVAYYPTLRHYREDRPVRTSVGKYLNKYKDLFGISERSIKTMAEKYIAKMQARSGWHMEFIEHNDPQGWVRVYGSHKVGSCMRGESAVRVYAHEHSVLRLSYLVDAGGDVIARCIVRDDDNKGWLRVYPDHNGSAEGRFLLDSLIATGYKDQINLDGVLLDCIEHGDNGYVCPYLDCGAVGAQNVDIVHRHNTSFLLVTESGDYDAAVTGGFVGRGLTCHCCGDNMSEGDETWIESEEIYVCSYCRDEHYVYAYGQRYQEYYPIEDCIEVDGAWYLEETAHHHDVHKCDYDGEWYHADDLYFFDEGSVHSDDIVTVDHEHLSEGRYEVHPDYVTTLSDGTTCHDDDEEHYQAEIDEANECENDNETNVQMSLELIGETV